MDVHKEPCQKYDIPEHFHDSFRPDENTIKKLYCSPNINKLRYLKFY